MKIVRFPLKPMSHFHLGEIAQDEKSNLATTSAYPHSDTLFSSLVNSYAQAFESIDVEVFIDDFKDRSTVISSMFYYLNVEGAFIYFLPKPLSYNTQSIKRDYYKKFKKIEFISTSVWGTLTDPNDIFNPCICSIIQDKFVVLIDEIDQKLVNEMRIYSKITQPKNPFRKEDVKQSIYFETDIEIADNTKIEKSIVIGYYFLYASAQEVRLKEAIYLMSMSGIGGGRSTGTGVLGNPEYDNNDIFNFPGIQTNSNCCISMAIPDNPLEFKQFELYETKIRGGRKMENGQQLFIRMIKEGAIVSGNAKGKLVEIGTDDHGNKVVRNGLCFILPLNTN